IGGCAIPPNAAVMRHAYFRVGEGMISHCLYLAYDSYATQIRSDYPRRPRKGKTSWQGLTYSSSPSSLTMSRRESRNSLDARQNDALFEFENFKKKFLLANKHITKLNSTLSVRIEELNAQISMLYTENLRLRASEIALAAELKREREKSRQIVKQTEAALPDSPELQRSRRYTKTMNLPNLPKEKRKNHYNLVHAENPKPKPIDFASIPPPPAKRKAARRQSGLLIDTRMETLENQAPASPLAVDRPPSPAFGSPIRRATGLAEQREEAAALRRASGGGVPLEEEVVVPAKKSKSSKSRDRDSAADMPAARPTERKKSKARDEGDGLFTDGGVAGVGKKLKLQDVTNSPHNGPVTSPIDTAAMSEIEAALAPTSSSSRSSSSHLPTPSPPPGERDADGGGRERRVRRSVNYTEPKLNTKMQAAEVIR
ncbi:hypothetical protein MPER_12992, partial [Moniliophthora perniciosa FA553]